MLPRRLSRIPSITGATDEMTSADASSRRSKINAAAYNLKRVATIPRTPRRCRQCDGIDDDSEKATQSNDK